MTDQQLAPYLPVRRRRDPARQVAVAWAVAVLAVGFASVFLGLWLTAGDPAPATPPAPAPTSSPTPAAPTPDTTPVARVYGLPGDSYVIAYCDNGGNRISIVYDSTGQPVAMNSVRDDQSCPAPRTHR